MWTPKEEYADSKLSARVAAGTIEMSGMRTAVKRLAHATGTRLQVGTRLIDPPPCKAR
jgi:hypothetical protein